MIGTSKNSLFQNMITSNQAQGFLHAGKVELVAQVIDDDFRGVCESGYRMHISRLDGEPLGEIELRTVLTNTALAIQGEHSLVVVERPRQSLDR